MIALLREFPVAASIAQGLIELATSLLARALQVPEPLLRLACLLMLVRIQAAESRIGKALHPLRWLPQFAIWLGAGRPAGRKPRCPNKVPPDPGDGPGQVLDRRRRPARHETLHLLPGHLPGPD